MGSAVFDGRSLVMISSYCTRMLGFVVLTTALMLTLKLWPTFITFASAYVRVKRKPCFSASDVKLEHYEKVTAESYAEVVFVTTRRTAAANTDLIIFIILYTRFY